MSEENKKIEEERKDSSGNEMNFLGHLEELRKRIVYAFIAVAVCSGLSAIFIETLISEVLLSPAKNVGLDLQNLKPFGLPFLYFKVIFISGIIIGFPFLLYQLWRFISPGLYENEKKWARSITFFTSICFLGGVVFAYYVMVPSMLEFASGFTSIEVRNDIDINEYLSFLTMILLAAGILFEMPMVSYVLARADLVTSKKLRKYWRHAIVVILILAAVLTPTPDPISQMIFAAPLLGLYELSILIAKLAQKKEN